MNNQFLDDIQNEIINAADKVFEDEDLIAEDINEDDEESEKARAQEFFKEDDKAQQVDEGNKITAYQLFMSEDELDDELIDEGDTSTMEGNDPLFTMCKKRWLFYFIQIRKSSRRKVGSRTCYFYIRWKI